MSQKIMFVYCKWILLCKKLNSFPKKMWNFLSISEDIFALCSLNFFPNICSPLTGLLTDREPEKINLVVEVAIENANAVYDTQLDLVTDEIPFGNSFIGYSTLCEMMEVNMIWLHLG